MPNGKIASTYGDRVWEWRRMVQSAVTEAMAAIDGNPQITGAIELRLGFDLPRPAGHFGTGRNSGQVKPSAPTHPTVAPDLDKLVRCVDDAITDSGFWHDDAQVVFIQAAKRCSKPYHPELIYHHHRACLIDD